MSKYWGELSWMRLMISSMGMLVILMVVPVRSLANISGSKTWSDLHPAKKPSAATSGTDNLETTQVTTIAEILTPSALTSGTDNPETTQVTL
ncbi:MAG: hypothetical protein DSM106950_21250 [Stigonema ocellatum SAG 48.90 = DSM 106950]|nr:hypothetical protein [Stigonema ocellatum SAG 48.90 = DSM 106950]